MRSLTPVAKVFFRFSACSARCRSCFRLRPCPAQGPSYNAAVLDIKLIREQPDFFRERLATRGAGDEANIDKLLKIDTTRRGLLAEVEGLKAQRNRVSKEIGALMAQKKIADAEVKKNETRRIGDKIKELDEQVSDSEIARNEILLTLPNLPHRTVLVGDSPSDNPVVRAFGEQKK